MVTLTRWNPARELAMMQSALDRIFDETWRAIGQYTNGVLAFDAYETDDAYTVIVELPGLNPDDINIRYGNGVLTVSGEFPRHEIENARVLQQERFYGRFNRSITLPLAVNADKIEATYEQGVLKLTLPKAPEAQPKQIKIGSNGRKLLGRKK
jgi:HSP20 family protein